MNDIRSQHQPQPQRMKKSDISSISYIINRDIYLRSSHLHLLYDMGMIELTKNAYFSYKGSQILL